MESNQGHGSRKAYDVMSKLAFSPTFMVVTPSSHPVVASQWLFMLHGNGSDSTFDDLSNTNGYDKRTTANGGIESAMISTRMVEGQRHDRGMTEPVDAGEERTYLAPLLSGLVVSFK